MNSNWKENYVANYIDITSTGGNNINLNSVITNVKLEISSLDAPEITIQK